MSAMLDSTKAVIAKLVAYISDRRLQPGDRLPSERELAERFGVGRNAVREALATLISLRVVETRPQSGIYLRERSAQSSFEALVLLSNLGLTPTEEEIAQTMEVRTSLERTAIELACLRRTEADLAKLRAIVDATAEILEADGNIADQDHAFHLALVTATQNEILVRVLNAFYELTLPRRRRYFEVAERGRASHEQHKDIVAALRTRNAERGVKLMQRHMETARTYWREELATDDATPKARRRTGRA
jgi:GntR family transcriptional regulator, transcriptional repressor for pyruvate dehydrogenase complex